MPILDGLTVRVLLLFEKHLGLTGAAAGLARSGRRARRVTSVHADARDRADAQPRGGLTRKAQRLGARRGSRARHAQRATRRCGGRSACHCLPTFHEQCAPNRRRQQQPATGNQQPATGNLSETGDGRRQAMPDPDARLRRWSRVLDPHCPLPVVCCSPPVSRSIARRPSPVACRRLLERARCDPCSHPTVSRTSSCTRACR